MENTLVTQAASEAPMFISLLKILLIDIVLSGDNAVVIAMAVRALNPKQRQKGIFFGAGVAVLLRVLFTWFATQLLETPLIKFFGGLLILWIAVKLLQEEGYEESGGKHAQSIWHAVWMIVIADFTMSLDNVLAIAGAAHGNLYLLLFGLGVSIPLVLFTSTLLSKIMAKYPIIVFIGAGILAHVGAEMVLTDSWVIKYLEPSKTLLHTWIALCIGGVITLGIWFKRKRKTSHGSRNQNK